MLVGVSIFLVSPDHVADSSRRFVGICGLRFGWRPLIVIRILAAGDGGMSVVVLLSRKPQIISNEFSPRALAIDGGPFVKAPSSGVPINARLDPHKAPERFVLYMLRGARLLPICDFLALATATNKFFHSSF